MRALRRSPGLGLLLCLSLLALALSSLALAPLHAHASAEASVDNLKEAEEVFREDALDQLGMDVMQMKHTAMLSFPGHPLPRMLSESEGECCQCARSVAEHILEETWNAIDAACSNVTCPFLKKRCDWIEEHQDEFTGYLAVRIRPMSDGYFYCYGNGTCPHPGGDQPTSSLPDVQQDIFSLDSDQALISQLSAAVPLIEKAMHEARKERQSGTSNLPPTSEIARPTDAPQYLLGERGEPRIASLSHAARRPLEHEPEESDSDDAADAPSSLQCARRCRRCLGGSVRWVMRHAKKALKRVCEHTQCPKMKKFCEWAKDHKEFVKGMLYAKVEPYKAATGWCFGRGECGHGGMHEEQQRVDPPISTTAPIELPSPSEAPKTIPEPLVSWAKAAAGWVKEQGAHLKDEIQERNDKHARKAHKKSKKAH